MQSSLRSLFLGILIVVSASAYAQFTSISDDFSNTGNLSGSTPDSGVGNWTNISGTLGAIQVSASAAILSTSSSEASQLNFSSTNLSSGTVYMGFDFTVSSLGTVNTNDTIQSFIGFRDGSSYVVGFGDFRPSGNVTTNNPGLSSTTTAQVAVGIFTGASQNASNSSLSYWSSVLDRGTAYRAILGFNLSLDTVSLWIDPNSSESTSITLSGVTANTRGVFLRQGNSSTGNITLDNLIVSLDFDTAAALTAVPEPSTYAAILGGVALIGVVAIRRRKRATLV